MGDTGRGYLKNQNCTTKGQHERTELLSGLDNSFCYVKESQVKGKVKYKYQNIVNNLTYSS